MHNLIRLLTTIGSVITIGFGAWHFFVPGIWNWYSYIDANAPELVIAIRAINAFFSLSLVLFGTINILIIYLNYSNRISVIIVLLSSIVLWITRVSFQIIYPQGSMNSMIQYGMLISFLLVAFFYIISLFLFVFDKNIA
ncbi:MAG: hypothetical protein A3J97_15700 [Spirochaetes bacterium RIFOXYC1_FULL_54_7]|nr:MAG: hypothetical protein A3J97_15700 [Spirochaetes bacterium RIFOXYC1_FULL_54_7]